MFVTSHLVASYVKAPDGKYTFQPHRKERLTIVHKTGDADFDLLAALQSNVDSIWMVPGTEEEA